MKILLDNTLNELEDILKENGFEKYRAKQIFLSLKNGIKFSQIKNIPKNLQNFLINNFIENGVEILKVFQSKIDDTRKFLLKLNDNNLIEAVLMKYKYGYSICISTQVGCRMACKFCSSGKNGLIRNLTAGELLGEVIEVNKYIKDIKGEEINHIVLMGSGEPFDNYNNVLKFLNLINSKELLNISRRNISLSTSGLVDKIDKFAEDGFNLTLTISLHAPNDKIRKSMMPVANRYSINQLVDSAKRYFQKTKRRVIFEYVLIYNVNDSIENAKELSRLLKGFSCHLNLINLNEGKGYTLKKTSNNNLKNFKQELERNNISYTLRRTLGSDIEGACGQLKQSYLENTNEGADL